MRQTTTDMMYKSPMHPQRKLHGIDATVIEHTVTLHGDELITFVTQAPKFLDAQIEKHRMISSNSSSDRAIPYTKLKDKPFFIPNDVRLNEKGMQGYTQLPKEDLLDLQWDLVQLRDTVTDTLDLYSEVHKQTLNRYLLPWTYQTKIMTMNKEQLDYFIGLRQHEHADPVIQALARKMVEAYTWSQPRVLETTEDWHLSFITDEEYNNQQLTIKDLVSMSVSRSAKVSYDNHDGTNSNLQKDIEFFTGLVTDNHQTPLEHQAKPMKISYATNLEDLEEGVTHITRNGVLMSGNFKGYIQFRQLLEQEGETKWVR